MYASEATVDNGGKCGVECVVDGLEKTPNETLETIAHQFREGDTPSVQDELA